MLHIPWSISPSVLYRIANTFTLDLLIQEHYYIFTLHRIVFKFKCLILDITIINLTKHIIYFHILHILTIVIFTLCWYESVKHYKGIKQSAEKWGVSKFMRGKKGHYMLVEKETCVCVCESCNYEDEDTAAVLTHYCFQWITMKNTVTLSVECHISGKNTTAFCLITILIFCQQWKEVMLDAGFVGYKCVQIMVLHPSFGKQPKIMRINTRRKNTPHFLYSVYWHS